jgi:hypothetical protein
VVLSFASLSLLLLSADPAASTSVPATPQVGIPFACGQTFTVSQAHDVGSHLQNDTWAWDFRMPEGVPIVAALDGTVRLARGDSTMGGCDPKFAPFANYVVMQHASGVETQYLHFSRVVVHEGDTVKAGEVLGYSGSTGWACGSHLHFKVAQPVTTGWNNPSVHATLVGYGDPDKGVVIAAPACTAPSNAILARTATVTETTTPAVGSSAAPSSAGSTH